MPYNGALFRGKQLTGLVRDKNLQGVFSMNKISTRFQMSSSLYRISEWFWNFFASWGLAFSDWLSRCSWQSRRIERYWRDIRTRGWVVMPNKKQKIEKVGIWITDESGIQMVKSCSISKWSGFGMLCDNYYNLANNIKKLLVHYSS